MPAEYTQVFLLASANADLLKATGIALRASCVQVETAQRAEDVLARIPSPAPLLPAFDLVLLDMQLPGMPVGQLLTAMQSEANAARFPIVLFSDVVTPEWSERLKEGVIDDLLPYGCGPDMLRLRASCAMQAFRNKREVGQLREAVTLYTQMDPLTGVQNRSSLLSALFRETDRAQRMNTPLSTILLDVDDFGNWNEQLGTQACDQLLIEVAQRITRLLRTYDLVGRIGKDEFLAALPGCSTVNAVLLAERMRTEIFSAPFHASGRAVRLSACFGVASSSGRSPILVLRDAEEALRLAREDGPESIRYAGDEAGTTTRPVPFISPDTGDDAQAW